MIRKPAVAGYFYPQKPVALKQMIEGMVDPRAKKEKAVAVVSPHAGFVYSGPVAGAVFSSVKLPERILILGPSHRSMRSVFAIMKKGAWQTPLGEVALAASLAEQVMSRSALVEEEESAHAQEHSLEVQIPFLQFFRQDFSVVPICISYEASYPELEDLGRAVSGAIRDSEEETLIVASTDMSHYVSQEVAKKKDFQAIEKVLALDPQGLYEVVQNENISMCGFQPTTAALVAAKELGAQKAELILYQTSGDRTGDYSEVVGYAGIRVT